MNEHNENLVKIILASSIGTVVEWYDFFVYGSLSTTLASIFYHTGTPTGDLTAFLASYAVGFIVRPFGAVAFGIIGDYVGRKYTFVLSLIIMGFSTFLIGCVPTVSGPYSIGPSAGFILIILRLIQGLAIGGEYGGAVTFISEHVPNEKRGFYTSFIQLSVVLGLVCSLMVISIVSFIVGEDNFAIWGWRICFWLSIFLVCGALYIRVQLTETPIFEKTKGQGKSPKSAWESFTMTFGNSYNLKYIVIAVFGATVGQGIVFYTSQFYVLTFIQDTLKVPLQTSYYLVGIPLAIVSPLYILVGYLSDRYGRKPFIMTGLALAFLTYYPLYLAIYHYRPFLDPASDALVDNPHYNPYMISVIVGILSTYSSLCYAPIGAFLAELFPTNIRYTCLSVTYHIGNGIFGGLVPLIGVLVSTSTNKTFYGLLYPIIGCFICFVIGIAYVDETYLVDIYEIPSTAQYFSEV
ncbi:major facilitator family transporter [Globomyces pollinis-pini]|nr:major facilitator family transporter [Globomyces pollinis-pini]